MSAAVGRSQPRSFGANPPNPILVEVVRGGLVESVHRGSALVLDADGEVVASAGAEGVHVAAVPGAGSVVVKIDDGNQRARMPVVAAELRRLGLIGEVLDRWASGPVLGGGLPVGTIRAINGLLS